jgi:hypothetical protein
MSTMGREADRIAEVGRKHTRRVAEYEIKIKDAVRFAIKTLDDWDIPDALARKAALDALRLKQGEVERPEDMSRALDWARTRDALLALGAALSPDACLQNLFSDVGDALLLMDGAKPALEMEAGASANPNKPNGQ